MSIKFRLTAMQFLQFFVWGAWLISLGSMGVESRKWHKTHI